MGVETGPWTGRDKFRLRQPVTRACVLGLRMRLYTLDELPDRAVILNTRDEEYNSGSGEECHYPGWRQKKGRGPTNMTIWPPG